MPLPSLWDYLGILHIDINTLRTVTGMPSTDATIKITLDDLKGYSFTKLHESGAAKSINWAPESQKVSHKGGGLQSSPSSL